MLISSRIELKPPALEWVEPLRLALSESYELHQLFLDWVEPDPSPLTVTATMNVAKEQFDRKEQELRFLIVRREDQELVGSISLHVRDVSVPYYELGYWVRQSAAGKGYITEAVLLLADYAFIHLHAARLEIRTAASNEKSRAVAERAGFRLEATLQNACRTQGHLDDMLVYSRIGHEDMIPEIDLVDISPEELVF